MLLKDCIENGMYTMIDKDDQKSNPNDILFSEEHQVDTKEFFTHQEHYEYCMDFVSDIVNFDDNMIQTEKDAFEEHKKKLERYHGNSSQNGRYALS